MNKLSSIIAVFLFLFSLSLLVPQQANAQQSQHIMLAGYKHNPPVPTSGSGMVTVRLKGDTLQVEGDFENLTSKFYGGYIMVSLRGKGGNQIYSLNVDLNEDETGGTIKASANTFVLSKAEKKLLKEGDLYLNISSFEHEKGELRGNIPPLSSK